jgi:hypothetical protein
MSVKAGPVKAVVPAKGLTPVRSATLLRACACGAAGAAGGVCESCAEKEKKKEKTPGVLQRSGAGLAPSSVPTSINSVLHSPGQPLDGGTREFMESRFGRDFSSVRVHTDDRAAESARAVNARAWTVGQDIAFARGEYRPHSHEGRGLLAHELAHTVQQSGLQRYPSEVRMGGALEPQLEREAETAARAVVGAPHDMHSSAVPVPSRVAAHTISRVPAKCPEQVTAKPFSGIEWDNPPAALKGLGVKKIDKAVPNPKIRRFNMGPFKLPPTKGPVKNCWLNRARAGALEAKYGVSSGQLLDPQTKASLAFSQGGEDTKKLRQLWEQKLGWMPDTAPAKWKEIKAKNYDPPTAANGKTCAMDHIIELQVGGTNLPENIQLLETEPNSSSGSTIRGDLSRMAREIAANFAGLEEVDLYFDDVQQDGAPCDSCCELEQNALNLSGKLAAEAEGPPEDTIAYPIGAGGFTRELRVGKKDKTEHILGNKWNDATSLLIPGMVLKDLHRARIDKIHVHGDHVSGCIAAEGCTDKELGRKKLPLRLKSGGDVKLDVGAEGQLKLQKSKVAIPFDFPYLSPGTITKLEYSDEAGLSGEGVIKPAAKFLPDLHIKFAPEYLALSAGIDENKLKGKSPLPGFKITKAGIDVQLFPEFKPTGTVAMEFAPGGKKLADGSVELGADAEGLTATGQFHAYIPGVDQAQIDVTYKGGNWSGTVTVESNQIKLPYVKSGRVVIGITKGGVDIDGKVGLEFPGSNTFEVAYRRGGGGWILSGTGRLNVPRLKTLVVGASYDGRYLKASLLQASPFTLFGITGNIEKIDYTYDTEKDKHTITGSGEAKISKGRATGSLKVNLHPNYKFSGEGTISYVIKPPDMVASATVILDENEKPNVKVKGSLVIPKYQIFPKLAPKPPEIEIFSVSKSFPIPGLSFGPLGLQFDVEASLTAHYSLGPGVLLGTVIDASFNPLEDDPDPKFSLKTMLTIPASAGITGTISAGVSASIVVAKAGLKLNASATADLAGGFFLPVQLHYERSKFTADAEAIIDAGLKLGIGLTATAWAEAGVWKFKVHTDKTWKLKHWDFDTGLRVVIRAPAHYDSEEGFRLPSFSDIKVEKPSLEMGNMLDKASQQATTEENES